MFIERKICIFCDNKLDITLFENNKYISINSDLIDIIQDPIYIPYNVYLCNKCNCYQNKYLGDLSIVYKNNHNNITVSNIWMEHYNNFYKFIINNIKNITNKINILEIGGGNNYIVELFTKNNYKNYTILEPNITNKINDVNYISTFLENYNDDHSYDITILSHVFEHLYNPSEIFKINTKYFGISIPNIPKYLDNFIINFLNIEHTYYFEEYHILHLFAKYNYKLINVEYFNDHSIFMLFEKEENVINNYITDNINNCTITKMNNYFDKIIKYVQNINNYMLNNKNMNIALFPAHFYISYLITFGFDVTNIKYMYDNNINKNNKYMNGTNLICKNLDFYINSDFNICLLVSLYNKEVINLLKKNNVKYIEFTF